MSWKKSKFASSFISLFTEYTPDLKTDVRVEAVRAAMLKSLEGAQQSELLETVIRRLTWAPQAQTLWYLRSEMMTLLSNQHGELEARKRLQVISDMFRGLLPAGQKSRPSPLSRQD